MFSRLIHRNIALLVSVVLAGQLLAGGLVMLLVIRPQVDRVANVTSDAIGALSMAMAETPPDRRSALLEAINRQGGMAIRPAIDAPSDGIRFPNFVERQFIRALAGRLTTQDRLVWRTDRDAQLWVRLQLGGSDYWISVTPPHTRGALASLLLAFCTAFIVAVAGGLALQRRLDQPLRRLALAVDGYAPGTVPQPLDTSGPQEVAAVATALNRMTERLTEQEAERAVMLGGVSHDLRTPLTRLRLCLEMMHCGDAELEATALRQIDWIEAMLAQFLDFARGFDAEPLLACDIATLIGQVVADHGNDAIGIEIEPGLGAILRPNAVARAIDNLVTNALRHGAPPVQIAARQSDNRLRIAISDGGLGIDPACAQDLIRPFTQGDAARRGEGAGLGLAIAGRVAAAHGGSLRFDRPGGQFTVTLEIWTTQNKPV